MKENLVSKNAFIGATCSTTLRQTMRYVTVRVDTHKQAELKRRWGQATAQVRAARAAAAAAAAAAVAVEAEHTHAYGSAAAAAMNDAAAASAAAAAASAAATAAAAAADVAAAAAAADVPPHHKGSAVTRALRWMKDMVAGAVTTKPSTHVEELRTLWSNALKPLPPLESTAAAAAIAANAARSLFDDVPWMFPLNTDGIDVGGRDVHIHDCDIENFDDAVAVKPSRGGPDASPDNPVLAACTENVLVEDVKVTNGVGMSVGSVPPHRDVNCVRNVTFRRIDFTRPFKARLVQVESRFTHSLKSARLQPLEPIK
jgi:hypothetical protein